MSTELETLKGKKEIPMGNRSEYIEKELGLTRFVGGTGQGTSLQISLSHDYIQLDHATVQRLIKILQEEFPQDN